ncbi:fatty acid desaturase [bacterium]|jgi:fatty acid desaturase|nr:fatty acid desaturase [bacterium]|tara:strand:- start:1165 stop:2193 length:1029 start_codon:yes stop_codon:yes gene_type:complete
MEQTSAATLMAEFTSLKSLVEKAGLYRKQPLFYILQSIWVVLLLTLNIFILFATQNILIQILNAVLLSFTFVQFGFLIHDTGHQQVFSRLWKNNLMGYICTFVLGISFSWWNNKHNTHHVHPNHEDMDPDIQFPFIVFSKERARETKGRVARFFVRNQGYAIIPIQFLMLFAFQISNIQFLLKQKAKNRLPELYLLIAHFVVYFGLVFFALGFWRGLIFILTHQLICGFYLGMVFATNHKGMPLLDEEKHPGFLRTQVLTARNIYSHPILDLFYGGLNYQIEHHLFPDMPRNMLRKTQAIVKKYCKEKSIIYHETGVIGSYVEIVQYMHEIGSVLRRKTVHG